MTWLNIITLVAAGLTLLSLLYAGYRKLTGFNKSISERMTNIELSLRTKQRFILPKDTSVILEGSSRILKLESDQEMIVDDIEGFMAKGTIYSNMVNIRVNISSLGEQIP